MYITRERGLCRDEESAAEQIGFKLRLLATCTVDKYTHYTHCVHARKLLLRIIKNALLYILGSSCTMYGIGI